MDKDKSISASNTPLFSKQWAREYRGSLFVLALSFIVFFYIGYQIISAYLSHQPENHILQLVGIEFLFIGLAIGSLTDWVKKEYPERESAIYFVYILMLSLAAFIVLLSYI
jgi:steroid 5-alpha reductase family enzyme